MRNISRKRYDIESSYQRETITKSHIGFPTKLKYWTFGDPERSRSLTEILELEYLANIADREFRSIDYYKVAYCLSNQFEQFELWWPWNVKVTNQKLRFGISHKRYEIESSYQPNTIIKPHTCFLKKFKYLTFGDPERSRSLTEIFGAEYLANDMR